MIYIIIGTLVFLTVVFLIEGLFFAWRDSKIERNLLIKRRIRAMSAGGAHGEKILDILRHQQLSTIPLLDRVLTALPRAHALDRALQQTGSNITVMKFLLLQLVTFSAVTTGLLLGLHLDWVVSASLGATLAFLIPLSLLSHFKQKRTDKLVEQLPETLDYIARSLRAGNPFSASIHAASEQMPNPIGGEFAITFDEINYGLSLEDALYNLGERTGTEEMRFFITSVVIQKQTGGNLAEILMRLAEMMRRRAKAYRDINTQAAEMQLSALILVALPVVVAAALLVFNPNYLLSFYRESYGPYAFVAQGVLILVGFLVMQKMIRFRV
ncbi:MAG: type II secretion system F family protein [Candidatus Sedimenticola sp. (ex Thyasira tokunagai)]